MTNEHDLTKIGTHHAADGQERQAAAFIGQTYYARGTLSELVEAFPRNPRLSEATFQIDYPQGEDDRQTLCFGQPVTLDEIRAIVERGRRA